MCRLLILTVLGLVGSQAYESQAPRFQVLAIIPHGRSPPLVDLTESSPPTAPNTAPDDLSVSSSQYYSSFEDYDDFRPKRESDEAHPDAYLKPPSEDASTPLWQDGNNWDLGYDPSEILSPPMPLSLGIPYDTIKFSSEEPRLVDVTEAQASSSNRQETRPSKPRQQKPRSKNKKRTPPPSKSFSSQRFSDYEDRPHPKRSNRYTDYEDTPLPPARPNKRQTLKGSFRDQESYSDYDEPQPPRYQQAAFSYAQTDQNGHYKWGVRHHQ